MRSSPLVPARIASGGCWRDDAVMREARSHRVVNSVTAQRHTFAQPQDGSPILHLLAVARVAGGAGTLARGMAARLAPRPNPSSRTRC